MSWKFNLLLIISSCWICLSVHSQSVKHDSVRLIIDTVTYLASPYKIHVDKDPFYPGGDAAFIEYIQKELVSPGLQITDKNPDQILTAAFYINPDGTTNGVVIQKGISVVIDHQIIRVINSSTGWKPAILNRQPVKQAYQITIGFAKN